MGHKKHESVGNINLGFVVVSDTVTPDTDKSTPIVMEFCKRKGWTLVASRIVPNRECTILTTLDELKNKCDILLFSGGTGPSPCDITVDVIGTRLSRLFPGIAEYFRTVSFKKAGPVALLSRACAGSIGRTAIFVVPGAPDAVQTALEILSMIAGHWVAQLRS